MSSYIPSSVVKMPSFLQHEKEDVKFQANGNSTITKANDHAHPYLNGDGFQHLPKPQQDILLLHGPRQKYCLEKTGEIPELRSDREILIQVGHQTCIICPGADLQRSSQLG